MTDLQDRLARARDRLAAEVALFNRAEQAVEAYAEAEQALAQLEAGELPLAEQATGRTRNCVECKHQIRTQASRRQTDLLRTGVPCQGGGAARGRALGRGAP